MPFSSESPLSFTTSSDEVRRLLLLGISDAPCIAMENDANEVLVEAVPCKSGRPSSVRVSRRPGTSDCRFTGTGDSELPFEKMVTLWGRSDFSLTLGFIIAGDPMKEFSRDCVPSLRAASLPLSFELGCAATVSLRILLPLLGDMEGSSSSPHAANSRVCCLRALLRGLIPAGRLSLSVKSDRWKKSPESSTLGPSLGLGCSRKNLSSMELPTRRSS
mmetsp:Transcript_49948/g.93540  ORF Transcript_49948/g.93540 Transcript_49948/m.93540 type:complete len:217 (-) Transcript_49948:16-666(-)